MTVLVHWPWHGYKYNQSNSVRSTVGMADESLDYWLSTHPHSKLQWLLYILTFLWDLKI